MEANLLNQDIPLLESKERSQISTSSSSKSPSHCNEDKNLENNEHNYSNSSDDQQNKDRENSDGNESNSEIKSHDKHNASKIYDISITTVSTDDETQTYSSDVEDSGTCDDERTKVRKDSAYEKKKRNEEESTTSEDDKDSDKDDYDIIYDDTDDDDNNTSSAAYTSQNTSRDDPFDVEDEEDDDEVMEEEEDSADERVNTDDEVKASSQNEDPSRNTDNELEQEDYEDKETETSPYYFRPITAAASRTQRINEQHEESESSLESDDDMSRCVCSKLQKMIDHMYESLELVTSVSEKHPEIRTYRENPEKIKIHICDLCRACLNTNKNCEYASVDEKELQSKHIRDASSSSIAYSSVEELEESAIEELQDELQIKAIVFLKPKFSKSKLEPSICMEIVKEKIGSLKPQEAAIAVICDFQASNSPEEQEPQHHPEWQFLKPSEDMTKTNAIRKGNISTELNDASTPEDEVKAKLKSSDTSSNDSAEGCTWSVGATNMNTSLSDGSEILANRNIEFFDLLSNKLSGYKEIIPDYSKELTADCIIVFYNPNREDIIGSPISETVEHNNMKNLLSLLPIKYAIYKCNNERSTIAWPVEANSIQGEQSVRNKNLFEMMLSMEKIRTLLVPPIPEECLKENVLGESGSDARTLPEELEVSETIAGNVVQPEISVGYKEKKPLGLSLEIMKRISVN